MGDDLTRHGDFRHGGGRDGARAGCSRRITRSTRLRETRMPRQDPKPSPDLAMSLALPGGCIQVGLDGHQQSLVRDRGLRSPTLCRGALSAGLLPGLHGVERGTGKTPGRTNPLEAVGQARAGRGWRHSSPRPPPSQRAGRLPFGLQQLHLHGQLPDPLHRGVQFRLHRIALAFLERGSYPGDRLLTPLLEPENLHAQLPRQEFHRLATQKPQGNLTLARHRPPLAKSQRACRRNLAWGKRGRAGARPRLPQGPSTGNFLLKIVGHVLVLLGHFDYANSVSKEIGSDSQIGCGDVVGRIDTARRL